eukprot:352178-Chlamydomonas_euryale.AAC.3
MGAAACTACQSLQPGASCERVLTTFGGMGREPDRAACRGRPRTGAQHTQHASSRYGAPPHL